ncbi:6-phosphogluconolactonase [Mucilaginibacter gracilis]|uniref:6-phosphogluconolactonase n=1 Tax=Mucilaginibacter gracilis TaxID=423350 RepID=A0A495J9U6_9SPHI|nr:lactonase family protein [Mucilaginibacter gracilis]RKR85258.1 6-phosphogluconolactonase [Mucilaginibacter gracilis]
MKKIFVLLLLTYPVLAMAQNTGGKVYNLLVGTYTTGKSQGIYVYHFDTKTGKITYQDKVTGVNNPSYLAVSSNRKFVYSVNEVGADRAGSVSSFSFNAKAGKLVLINKQPSNGGGPCYISVDRANKNVFIANYAGGSLSVLPIKADGSLAEPSQTIQDEGTGPNTSRQAGPHVHTAVLSPDEKLLLYTDLGTDKLNIMRYAPAEAKPLTPASPAFIAATGGDGPRHIAFSPNGKFMYLICEMGGDINTYEYNDGQLKKTESNTLVPDGFQGIIGAADIHISPDGRYLYSTNRGSVNEIEVFAVNKDNGKLTFIERTSSLGKTPRNFVIDPTGNFLLVANQTSDDVYVFRINKTTGKLTYTGEKLEVGNPSCLKFAAID